MGLEKKVEELAEKVHNLQQKNSELEQRNRKLEQKIEKHIKNGKQSKNPEKNTSNKVSRRKFLKMLGVGAGGLALSSSVAGSWSIVRPSTQGTSDINAEVASGLKSSVVGDGLKNGQSSALSVEPSDFAGSYLQDDGNDNLEVDTSSVATRSWVNSNADVPNADYADSAGNADQLDGNHASAFATNTDLTNHANSANVHHSRPNSTQNTASSPTWTDLGSYNFSSDSNTTIQLSGQFIDGVEVGYDQSYPSEYVESVTYTDGVTFNPPQDSAVAIPAGKVDSIKIYNNNVDSTTSKVRIHEVGVPSHAHDI